MCPGHKNCKRGQIKNKFVSGNGSEILGSVGTPIFFYFFFLC